MTKDKSIITPRQFVDELRRYQKGSVTRRHFLGVTGLGLATAVLGGAMPGLKPRKAYAALSGTLNFTTWPNYFSQENFDNFTPPHAAAGRGPPADAARRGRGVAEPPLAATISCPAARHRTATAVPARPAPTTAILTAAPVTRRPDADAGASSAGAEYDRAGHRGVLGQARSPGNRRRRPREASRPRPRSPCRPASR